ncbi:Putative phage tail protein [Treponema bryantii]|uniref:Putative phage tail protein n=1 Tax=Treponema bryantii TaxID=163 RepID=A0A1H9G8L8_9SPIR|nr:host specificity factor TipJ family phage tail protein [Treponema bryantii]SEQ46108.1 Putative phage tail protein [Treponema bryantii]
MSIQVTACLNPFSQERKDFNFEQGISIQKIINKIDALHAVNAGWRVMIDDEIITDFERIPEEGQRVYLKLVPENDSPKDTGAGMKVGGAALAVLGVILCFTPVAPLGAALVGAGIGMFAGGMALYNINIPDVNMNDREKPEQDPSIRGSRNQMRPYGVVPVLLGRRRIYADQCANPYTWVDDDGDIWLYQLFCVGQKDLQIETNSIKIEETLLKNYSATGDIARILDPENPDPLIQMQIAYGGTSSPLYNKCVHEIQLNTLLKHETEDGQDGAIIRTTPDGTTELNVDIFFYSGLGKYNDSGDVVNTSVEVKVEYKRSNLPDSQYALLGYFNEVDQNNVITGCNLKTRRLALTLDHLISSAYTVRITRVSADSTDSKIIDSVYVGSIRAAKNESPVRSERCQQITQIGLKIKASEKLNNVIEQLNFIAQSKLPVYQNGQWTNALSSNPASAAMYAMQGDVAQQKLSDSEIETEAFSKLFSWCNNHGYSCNAYVTESLTVNDLLARIASTCRAEILRMNGKITVIQDIEKESFVQLFTPRNSHDYKETMALADIPDEMKMGFVDSSKGFADNEAHVYNTPSGNQISGVEPQTSQSVPLWGVTNSEQARKLGMYNYAVSKHRFVIVRFSCDFEYLMCRKGDWIKYAGDIALAGLKQGRIESVDGQKILLDEQVTMESGKTYAVRIRKSDGSAVLCNVQTVAGGTNELTIIGQMPSGIEGCLFAFGITGNETVDLLVTDIQCGENLSADLICVEYAPEIFGVDNPDFVLPDFVNHLSEVDSVIEPADVSEWRTFQTYNDSESMPSTPTGGGTSGDWHLQQTENSKWISTKTAASIYDGEWSAPVPTGKKVMDLLVPDGEIGNPDSVDELVAVANRDSISISWSAIRDNGLNNSIKCYILKISKDNGVSWSDPIYLTDCSYEYVFTRTGQGSDGYPEASAFANWKVEVVAENIYGKKSTAEQKYVDAENYDTWIPTVPSDVKAVANKDYILLSWSCNLRGVYGTNLYRIKKNGTTIAEGIIENSFVYYFDRSSNEYPEKSDFDTNTWKFTVEVYNESPTTRYADAVYDKSNYKSWLPAIPRMGVTSSGRTISVDIRADDSYWGWDRFELQLSNDNQNWFAANTSESYDAYASEEGWKGGVANSDTDVLSTQFYMELPLSGQAADNPVNTSYYVRVRAVTHTNTDKKSAFCESIMVVAKASGVKDIVNSAVTTAKLANEAVTGDKISADTITARKLNVVATNLVNPIINDTPSDSSVTRAVSRWAGLKAISDPATGFVIGERTGNISSDAFTILPDAVYEFKFGIECSNYASGSGLFIGLNAAQSLKCYKWNATKKQWFYESTSTNKYFLSDYKTNSRKYFTTYILGTNVQTGTGTSTTVPAQNIPAPVMTDNTYEIYALQLTGTLRETFIRSGNNTISGSPVWKIITPQIYERNSSAITAEDIKTQNLSAINANLGDVATGSLSSATNSDGKPDPANSLVHINGTAGSEEFFIGNIKKSSASETNTNHEFMWLHKVNGVFTFILKITNFIVTSTQSIIKGILRIKNSLSDTDANAFLTVNPTSSTNNSTPANTMRLLGTLLTKGIRKEWTQLDLSSLDASKWFPVTIPLSTDDWTEIDCYVSLDSGTKPSWSSHNSGFTCHLHLLAMGAGWGTTSAQTLVLDRQYGFTTVNNVTVIPAGWTQMTNSSTGVLWLRGGGKYRVWNNKGVAFTIRTSTYTASDQSVTPTTSYQWSFTRAQMWGNIDGNATSATSAEKLTTARKVYVKLGTASTTETKDFSGDTAIPVNGTLEVANGGTGQTSLSNVSVGFADRSKVARSVVGWCTTASATQIKDITLDGFTDSDLVNNATIIFYLANKNTHLTPKLRVGGTGNASKDIASSDIPFHKGLYIARYNGGGWYINPLLNLETATSFNGTASQAGAGMYGAIGVTAWYFSTTGGYIVYSNGLKIQWEKISFTSTSIYTFSNLSLPISFSSKESACCFVSAISADSNSFGSSCRLVDAQHISGILYGIYQAGDRCQGMCIWAIGY